ncbi:hypothetical protein BH09PSE4_BH09PSE4_01760 [soil metagenome]
MFQYVFPPRPVSIAVAPRVAGIEAQLAIPGEFLAAALLSSLAALALLMRLAQLTVLPWALHNAPFYLCGVAALGLHFGLRDATGRVARAIADGAQYIAILTLIVLLGAVASYPMAAESHGFSDAALQRVDLALHFDWLGWYRLVAAHPMLQEAGRIAYQSIYLTPALLLGYFAWGQHRVEARRFLATFWLAALITLALFPLMPAVGPLAYLWRGPIPYMPESALWQPELIPALRLHAIHQVDLGVLRGLVSAPSFHTVAAILYIATAWRIRRLRWPVTAVNLAMLLATPVEGTHYLADMLAGAGVAMVAILLVSRLAPRNPQAL